jgi:4-amino-4-deoxy-L-arabinose transferase-like glycosyltransferase
MLNVLFPVIRLMRKIKTFIISNKKETIAFLVLFLVSFFLRFWGLGYSSFYGDETKTFYLDKTVPAINFFLNQRKGPVQFFVVWTMEKILGGFNEFWTRVPFAVAGLLAVFVVYLISRELFNWRAAIIVSFLFSVNGFYLAFSKTIQYQSFLLLFSLLGLYAFYKSCDCIVSKYKEILLLISGISYGFAFLCHYDAIFFLIPVFYFFVKGKVRVGIFVLNFITPLILLSAVFYVPYVLQGYFDEHTVGYISRRVTGSNFALNNSLGTYYVYNPYLLALLVLIAPFSIFFMHRIDDNLKMLFFWFIVSYTVFELIILNPGTHIHVYYIPLIFMFGYLLWVFLSIMSKYLSINVGLYFMILILSGYFFSAASVFVPQLSLGYPWVDTPSSRYHLYLYGFPYFRNWRGIRSYLNSKDGVRGIYTNDNDTIAEYYLHGIDYTPPGSNFLPQYYIHVSYPQQLGLKDVRFEEMYQDYYIRERDFFEGDRVVSTIYRLNGETNQHW